MLSRNRGIILGGVLLLLLLQLIACVSINNKVQLVSNTFASGSNLQSCEVSAAMDSRTGGDQGLDPKNISFLNWNIYKGDAENWQDDLSSFAQSHDVMTIQEAMLNEKLTGLLDNYELDWVMNAAFYLNGIAAGVMTAANAEVLHSCGFKVAEPLIRVPKSTLVSYYAIRGSNKKLLVANIHGINFTLGVDTYQHQLDQLYKAIKHHGGPMIVAGDFNSWSNDRMLAVMGLVKRLSLSKISYAINNKTHVFGKAIDHVFYRQLELVNNQVWQVSSSDHNPISVNFRLRSEVF